MPAPGVIVLEKQTCWEAELKHAWSDGSVKVRACRLAAQIPSILAEMPSSVLVLHTEIGATECLRLIAKSAEITPPIRIVLIVPMGWNELEWSARELGAAEFLSEPLSGPQLTNVCRRLLGNAG